ncbi:acyltransferase family protein [Methylomonas sp. OY6]|uniref:Acyltransferase family protein n=1 Tax=Methylomonas defluvii TaxID=3045149 RepID=A0ABU4UCE1_9GAMM|nr:acyltransferase family protein [Methylomonas sp. OY6]MDX8127144.1 acyltransferase family protein [Methylomonas sp. OY6]
MDKKNRLVDIDKAKGFAIFLVVLGHIVATDMPAGNEWYAALKFYIYKFHMPFFMFISGIIMAYTFRGFNDFNGYLGYIVKKLRRLAPGYLFFGFLIYAGKLSMSNLMHVDDVPGDIGDELYNLLVFPSKSAGGSLWFIYVLMEMYVVFPLVIVFFSKKLPLIVVFGFALEFVPVTNAFMLDRFCEYFLFFSLWVFIVANYEVYLSVIEKYSYVFILLFFLSFLTIPFFADNVSKVIIGICSLPALQVIMRRGGFSNMNVWQIYGLYTYSIYLMNTIFIGVVKGIILSFTTWDGLNFIPISVCLLIGGVYGPIFVKKFIFSRAPFLDRITS